MSENENRLIRCFASVFPELNAEEIRRASADSTASWDSLTAVTLAAVIQEEFCLEIDPEALPDLGSYQALGDYLARANPAGE